MDIHEQIKEHEKLYPPVDINSTPGTKLVFTGIGGYPEQNARGHQYLTVGETYTLAGSVIGGWSSTFYLEGFEGIAFNSVLFSPEGWSAPSA